MLRAPHCLGRLALLVLALVSIGTARAEDIAVSNYGTAASGMPYAIALDKGYFRDEGADVTGIIAPPAARRRSAPWSAAAWFSAKSA